MVSVGLVRRAFNRSDSLNVRFGLKEATYDVVMIGAGVRKDDDHFLIFEKLVNVVHEHAPKGRIVFNTGPMDSDAAIQRWA